MLKITHISNDSKLCKTCNSVKSVDCFSRTSRTKSGIYSKCKDCQALYRIHNRDKIMSYAAKNKEKHAEQTRIWRINNRERLLEYDRKRHKRDREKERQYYKNNRAVRREKEKEYLKINKSKRNAYLRSYDKARRSSDTLYKLSTTLRNTIYRGFRYSGIGKPKKTELLLGCSIELAKEHIERQFKKGMTWKNHGQWHIDHIVPLASAKTEEDLIFLCHYTNLQPLWAKDNILKGRKIVEHQLKIAI